MRILSQEGREAFYDFPYDKCLVYIYGDKKTIKLQPLGEVDSEYVMATYSTEEKAIKVIEKLKESYLGKDCGYKCEKGILYHAWEESQAKIFLFPKDEEVEL